MKIISSLSDAELVTLLQSGAVGVLPTDTLYGLVCSVKNPAAVARLYALKHREHKPGTLIAANVQQLEQLGLNADHLHQVEAYWPGAISIIIPCGPKLEYLHQGLDSLAARVPDKPALHELLLKTGPLLTSSANHPGEQPATNVQEAIGYFGDAVDFIVDGGDLYGSAPSTIIRVAGDTLEVIRQGAVMINEE